MTWETDGSEYQPRHDDGLSIDFADGFSISNLLLVILER